MTIKDSRITQELANYFPGWSRVRTNKQSIGYTFLNAMAQSIDGMDRYLERMGHNYYLATVNLDEVDWLYSVSLPTTYEFSYNTSDPLNPKAQPPTVRGFVVDNTLSGYVDVSIAEKNNLDSLWYSVVPDRADLEETVSGDSDVLLEQVAGDFPWSGYLEHHIGQGGKLWVEASGGTQYVYITDDKKVNRARVILTGTTSKSTEEKETLVFPWDGKQRTLKEWKSLDYIDIYDMESGVDVSIKSADFDNGPYMAFYNLRWSEEDTKIDEFWDIGASDNSRNTLDLVEYASHEWQNLLLGFSTKVVKNQWELLDADWNNITPIDMTIQPFTDRAWMCDSAHQLYCYDIEESLVSGLNYLTGITNESRVRLEVESCWVVLDDDMYITPLLVRPEQQVDKYRVWYMTPSGTKYGLLNGSQVAYSSDFWNYPQQFKRELEGQITVTSTERGEYLFVLEAVFPDTTTHTDKVIVSAGYKLPLSTIDLSTHLTGETLEGIDFDSDQRLWIKTSTGYYRFSLHKDLMMIDYTDKILYFREDYEDVEVT